MKLDHHMFHSQNKQDCKVCENKNVKYVVDSKTGTLICTTCGNVLRSNMRVSSHYSYKYGPNEFSNVGSQVKTTYIGTTYGTRRGQEGKLMDAKKRRKKLNRYQNMISMNYKDERFQIIISRMIDEFQEKMNLNRRITVHANGIAQAYYKLKKYPIRKTKIIAAVCVCLACRRLKVDRTYKEFAQTGLIKKKELGTYVKVLSRLLNIRTQGADPGRLINRFGSQFDLIFQRKQRIKTLIKYIMAHNLVGGRCPHSILCVCLFVDYHVSTPIKHVILGEISQKMEIAVNTSSHCMIHLMKNQQKMLDFYTKKDERERFLRLCNEYLK